MTGVSIAFWVCAVVTVISAGVSLGYAVAGLRAASGSTAVTASRYALARSAAFAALAIAALVVGSVAFLAAVATSMVIVQALDAFVGAAIPDRIKTVGPAATAVLGAATVVWMLVA